MKTIFTLFYRDMRRFGLLSICIFAVFMLMSFLSYYFPIARVSMHGMICAGAMMSAISIVLDMPLCGTSEFWMTRPISGVQLFVSKLASVIILCALLPALILAIVQVSGLTVLREHSPLEHISLSNNFSLCLIVALISMFLSSVSENKREFVVFLFFAFLVSFLLVYFFASGVKLHPETMYVLQYREVFWRILRGVFYVGIVSILLYQYVRRNRRVAITAFVILILLMVAIQQLWPTMPRPA